MRSRFIGRSRRAGFTLPEVLLAILLLAIGLLGLASSATVIAAQAGSARELARATLLLGSVLDSLRAAPCRAVANGSRTQGRAAVTWVASPVPRSVHVTATLTLAHRSGPRAWPVESLVPCDR